MHLHVTPGPCYGPHFYKPPAENPSPPATATRPHSRGCRNPSLRRAPGPSGSPHPGAGRAGAPDAPERGRLRAAGRWPVSAGLRAEGRGRGQAKRQAAVPPVHSPQLPTLGRPGRPASLSSRSRQAPGVPLAPPQARSLVFPRASHLAPRTSRSRMRSARRSHPRRAGRAAARAHSWASAGTRAAAPRGPGGGKRAPPAPSRPQRAERRAPSRAFPRGASSSGASPGGKQEGLAAVRVGSAPRLRPGRVPRVSRGRKGVGARPRPQSRLWRVWGALGAGCCQGGARRHPDPASVGGKLTLSARF